MPKDTKTLGNNKARACESLGFVHKKRLCQRFDTTSFLFIYEDYSSLFNWKSLRRKTKLLLKYFSRTILFSANSSGVP